MWGRVGGKYLSWIMHVAARLLIMGNIFDSSLDYFIS